MSVFCPKCEKRTYNEYNCDYCNHEIKKSDIKKETININYNQIITIAVVVIAISVSYLAFNKITEDTPQEKALKVLYGTTDKEKIKKINNDIVKESEKSMTDYSNAMENLTKDILGKK